jgi:hypothetical protein
VLQPKSSTRMRVRLPPYPLWWYWYNGNTVACGATIGSSILLYYPKTETSVSVCTGGLGPSGAGFDSQVSDKFIFGLVAQRLCSPFARERFGVRIPASPPIFLIL